ncbi:DUF1579 domain-containing protein [Bosea sp. 2KB_26]|uniref:DUF1579 domain-containing protein n=1 Tax=Bosea sp. 2KB_26 TaxID=3237475 RepID=UPI003F8E3FEC
MSATSRNGFDFNHGEWRVSHRKLRTRGVGSGEWDQFETRTDAQLLMGGTVSIDETDFTDRGFKGMSLRLYDPAQDQWAIYWINSSDGAMQPPVFGRFTDGKGVFEGDDLDGVRPIRVRFEWTGTETATPQWSQAFSYDDGQSWETNWVMLFRRPQ